MIPKVLKLIRHAYVLFMSYLLINIFVCLGLVANITGVVSKETPSRYFQTGLNSASAIFITMVLSTIAYIIIEIAFREYLKREKVNPVYSYPAGLNKFFAYFYLIVFSYMGYLFSMCFISNKLLTVSAVNITLDIIVIYFLIKLFIPKTCEKKLIVKTWITMVLISILMIIPYSIFYMPMIHILMPG